MAHGGLAREPGAEFARDLRAGEKRDELLTTFSNGPREEISLSYCRSANAFRAWSCFPRELGQTKRRPSRMPRIGTIAPHLTFAKRS